MPAPPPSPQSSITLNDVYYVVFRHKWTILGFTAAGILVAAILYIALPTKYSSEARLLVRYVMENRSMAAPTEKDQVKSPDSRGETIINSELEILTSLDLAEEVADAVGSDKVLAKAGGGTNRLTAAAVIANPKNLIVEVPKNSSIIRVRFEHPDPTVVQPVLKNLIESYVKKHLEIHRGVGVLDDFLNKQTDQLRSSLTATEAEMWKRKTNAGIISVEDSKKAFNDQIMKIQDGLLTAEAELAEAQAAAKELEKLQPATAAAAAEIGAPADKIDEYKRLCETLKNSRKRESESTLKFSDENPMLKLIRSEIAEAETKKTAMETNYPKLATLNVSLPTATYATDSHAQALDPMTEFTRAKALEAKVKVLTAQLVKIRAEAALVDEAGTEITRLQHKRELDEASYRYYLASTEQARVDQALGPGRITNISVVQSPSPPSMALSKKGKAVLGVLFGVIGSGIALAFGLELFLDPRVKRPSEIETKLHLPLFLSIPRLARNGHAPAAQTEISLGTPDSSGREVREQIPDRQTTEDRGHTADDGGQKSEPISEIQAFSNHKSDDPLRPYCEAVRDRLTMYFQTRNMTNKPKLVGVTSCGRHSGVTAIASGLAAAVSEIGSGNVLLVDMGIPNGVAHPFHNGKPVSELNEALETDSRSDALIRENLFLATTKSNSNSHGAGGQTLAIVPAKFSALMPRLKESDYDYIIFDMPPLTSTSSTASLASMLDMTFLVLEAEKSNRETVKRSIALLTAGQANVAAILNKTRNYLPAWLHEEV